MNKQLKGKKNPDKEVMVIIKVSEGFGVKEGVEKNVREEIDMLANYIINNMKDEEPWH